MTILPNKKNSKVTNNDVLYSATLYTPGTDFIGDNLLVRLTYVGFIGINGNMCILHFYTLVSQVHSRSLTHMKLVLILGPRI
jgi:hypothetical protein